MQARRLAALLALGLGLSLSARAAAATDAPFLWQVQGKQATHFLLGSVHLRPGDAEGLPDGILGAYEAADGLVFESDLAALSSPRSGLAMLAAAKSEAGIRPLLDRPTYARLRERMAQLGMPRPLCEQYKPWFCALSLEIFEFQQAGFTAENGLDRQLSDYARADGKTMSWFEAPDAHLDLFAGMNEQQARELLDAALDDREGGADAARRLYKAWRDNNIAELEGEIGRMKQRHGALYDRLIAARNRAWQPRLKALLDGERPQLIVVGAAHWVGPDGLLAALKAAGFRPRPYVVTQPELVTEAPLPLLIRTALASAAAR